LLQCPRPERSIYIFASEVDGVLTTLESIATQIHLEIFATRAAAYVQIRAGSMPKIA